MARGVAAFSQAGDLGLPAALITAQEFHRPQLRVRPSRPPCGEECYANSTLAACVASISFHPTTPVNCDRMRSVTAGGWGPVRRVTVRLRRPGLRSAEPGRLGQQPPAPRLGPGRHQLRPAGARQLRRRAQCPGQRAQRALCQQPGLPGPGPERVLRAPQHPVGVDLGPVPRPHLRPRPGRHRGGQHPVRQQGPAGTVHRQPRLDPVHPLRPGTGYRRHQRPPAGQHRQLLPRRVARLRRHRPAAGVAARGPGRRQPGRQRPEAAAARRVPAAQGQPRRSGDRPGHGRRRPARRAPRPRDGRR